jgi:phage terminase large subunit-like protein
VLWLSTQSNEPPAGVWRQKLQYARGVRDGRIVDPQFCPVLYEFPEQMIAAGEHRNPANFYVTNPNLGASVDESFLVREFAKAEEAGEESVRGFLAKHLNVEIGLSLMSDRWAGAEFWEAQGTACLTLEAVLDRCEVVEVGLDGGGLDDLFGVAVMGRETNTGNWLHWGCAFAHPTVMERRKSEAARFADFARDGDLRIVKAIGDDVAQIVEMVMQCEEAGLLDRVGVDVAGIGAVVDALVDAGLPLERIVSVPQGWRMAGAIKTAERKLAEGALWHGGTALMAWCVGNAKIEPKANAVMITKQAAGFAKIDPLMALFNAVSLLMMNPHAARRNVCGELVVL